MSSTSFSVYELSDSYMGEIYTSEGFPNGPIYIDKVSIRNSPPPHHSHGDDGEPKLIPLVLVDSSSL